MTEAGRRYDRLVDALALEFARQRTNAPGYMPAHPRPAELAAAQKFVTWALLEISQSIAEDQAANR